MDRRLVCATESFAANCRGTRQHYQSHRGGRIGQRRCSDCPTAQWSCESPIENSPSSTSAPTARGWDRLSQEIPLKDNGQLYRGRQARESGLTENFTLGRRELLMGRSDFHNSEGYDKKLHGMISNDAILSPSSLKKNRRSTGLPGKFPTRWLVTTVFPSFASHAIGSHVYSYLAEASVFHSLIAARPLWVWPSSFTTAFSVIHCETASPSPLSAVK